MANVADGATGTVLTAPSPATSGTSVVLNAGEGYRFPAVPFFAIMHPNNTIPTVSTAEKVQVTAQGQTTIASGSNGASLPQATINVVDATSLPSAGSVTILNNAGAPQLITYTGKTGTTLTGASGGTGTLATGGAVMGDNFTIVRAISPYSAQSVAVTWRFSNAIFASDLNNASFVRNEVPVGSINGSNTAFTTASQFQTNSLMVYKNGIRLKGGGADFTATAGGFTMVTAPATGTVLLVDYFIGGTINNIGTNSLISDETPAGTVNGSNAVFTTARPYIPTGLEVYVNGLKQFRTTDFVETTPGSGVFTFNVAPLTGDVVRCNYQYNLNPASNADTVDGFHAASLLGQIKVQKFTASGTYTPDPKMLFCIIECWGAGGGGGNVIGVSNYNLYAAGGGSGGYSRLTASAATIGASKAVTIGSGGAGNSSGSTSTGNTTLGGDTSVGTICVAKGGGNGGYIQGGIQVSNAGAGGSTTGAVGDITAAGMNGLPGFYSGVKGQDAQSLSGGGGSTMLGGAGVGQVNAAGANATANTGSGGSGGSVYNVASNVAGGNGASGFVIITEYCQP